MTAFLRLTGAALLVVALASGSAEASERKRKAAPAAPAPVEAPVVNDPFEHVNRGIFAFNRVVDDFLIRPIVTIYTTVIPQPLQDGVANVFGNVDDAFSGVNNVLQGKPERAGKDFGRVLVNTTLGIGGIFDVGARMGLEKVDEDFGQTLAVWGVGGGPYVVLPLLGPSNVRDAIGRGARIAADPRMFLPAEWAYSAMGLNYISFRSQTMRTEGLLDAASFDRYGFVRSSYLMRRNALIADEASRR